MSDPFLGEIAVYAFNWAPRNYMICDGALMPIQTNAALFSLLSTTFGGNGTTTFALPDLRGRAPMGQSSQVRPGYRIGSETVTLNEQEIPPHTHQASGSTNPGQVAGRGQPPAIGALLGTYQTGAPAYTTAAPAQSLSNLSLTNSPGGSPHNNMQPSTVISYCIAIYGLYPSRP